MPRSTLTSRSLVKLLAATALAAIAMTIAHGSPSFQSDGFVRMIERHVGVVPGQTSVLQECSCSVKYLGTQINGRVYTVVIEKLD
jgi:hypothetical protein